METVKGDLNVKHKSVNYMAPFLTRQCTSKHTTSAKHNYLFECYTYCPDGRFIHIASCFGPWEIIRQKHNSTALLFNRSLKTQWEKVPRPWLSIMDNWEKCQRQYWGCKKKVRQLFQLKISQETYTPGQSEINNFTGTSKYLHIFMDYRDKIL